MQLCLFEDHRADDLAPLADTRPVWDLLLGSLTLRQRIQSVLRLRATGFCARELVAGVAGSSVDGVSGAPVLLVNGAAIATPALREAIESAEGENWVMVEGERVVAARLDDERSGRFFVEGRGALAHARFRDLPTLDAPVGTLVRWLWDLLDRNAWAIEEDAVGIDGAHAGIVSAGAHMVCPERIGIDEGATIAPGVVLDASGGPIIIDAGVTVMASAVIQGPCAIGAGSTIKIGAKIYGGTAIGPRCKVGGEVENSTLIGYGNKQHDGFLGHSYLGAWTNLGADTNTSDLKNNYGQVRVELNGQTVGTGRMFLGTLAGDHVRTGINTMLNTGTVAGVFSNIFGGGFPPKVIPAFAWGGSSEERYRLDDALSVARTVMARRDVVLDPETERLYRALYNRPPGTAS